MISRSLPRWLSAGHPRLCLHGAMAFLLTMLPVSAAVNPPAAQDGVLDQKQLEAQTQPSSESHHPGGHAASHAAGAHPAGGECHQQGDELHSFEDTQRWIDMFERPERADTQKPEEVVAALELEPGQTVADIGAGSGYFTFHLARAVGPHGRVLAVDIEEGMLDAIRGRRAGEKGGGVVSTILADPDNPNLPDGQVDLVLIVNTYHHIQDRVAYLRGLKADMAAGGRVAIVDYRKEELPVGPPLAHKLERQAVIGEFEQAGYTLSREESFLPYQYYLIFKK